MICGPQQRQPCSGVYALMPYVELTARVAALACLRRHEFVHHGALNYEELLQPDPSLRDILMSIDLPKCEGGISSRKVPALAVLAPIVLAPASPVVVLGPNHNAHTAPHTAAPLAPPQPLQTSSPTRTRSTRSAAWRAWD